MTDCSRLENTDISNKREFELLIRRRGSFERIEGYLEDLEEGNREIAEERRRRARMAELEARIRELEEELETLGRQLANPPPDRAELHRIGEDYMRAESNLEIVMEEMERLQDGNG